MGKYTVRMLSEVIMAFDSWHQRFDIKSVKLKFVILIYQDYTRVCYGGWFLPFRYCATAVTLWWQSHGVLKIVEAPWGAVTTQYDRKQRHGSAVSSHRTRQNSEGRRLFWACTKQTPSFGVLERARWELRTTVIAVPFLQRLYGAAMAIIFLDFDFELEYISCCNYCSLTTINTIFKLSYRWRR